MKETNYHLPQSPLPASRQFPPLTQLPFYNPATFFRNFIMTRNLRIISVILLFFVASPPTHGSHPKLLSRDFEGVITAITKKSVTVKNSEGTRVFEMMRRLHIRGEDLSSTCLNGLNVKDEVTDVFTVGDEVVVIYFPEIRDGKEAADLWYSDRHKAFAWRKTKGW